MQLKLAITHKIGGKPTQASRLQPKPQSQRLVSRQRFATTIKSELRTARGTKFDSNSVQVRGSVGEGSFGQVFQGTLTASNGEVQEVILKRVKARVMGAQEMQEMEHLLNVYATSAAKRAVAPFLGYLEVEQNVGKLTTGLWLVWEYEGDRTLAYYLRRRDCISALAEDLDVDEDLVIPTVMQQIFESLNELHNAGVIHRDVKPANIVFADNERRFKFIDLGAAADLRTGTNYRPTETILDPCYCPPEEYILPTDAPHLAKQAAPMAMVMSPLLWSRHRPDCFDTWSCGVVLMQLALPFLRTQSGVKQWRGTLARFDNDIEEWRARSMLSAKQTTLLDANDGLGWDLAYALLRPREIESDKPGSVRFITTNGAPRLTAAQALKHPFVKMASSSKRVAGSMSATFSSLGSFFSSRESVDEVEETAVASTSSPSSSSSKRGGGSTSRGSRKEESGSQSGGSEKKASSGGSGLWTKLWDRVQDLEARVMKQASDTKTQSVIVDKLREDVSKGKVSQEVLQSEEKALKNMEQSLRVSVKDLGSAFAAAKGFFGGKGGSQKGADSDSGSGSRGSGSSSSSSGYKSGSGGSTGRGTGSGSESRRRQEAADQAAAAADQAAAAAAAAAETPSTEKSGGSALAGFATNAIYTGLKLTGMAVQSMGDLAASVEQSMAKAQAEAEAQRAARTILINIIQGLDPPLTVASTYTAVKPLLPPADNPKADYSVLTERQVRTVVETYVTALKDVEEKRKRAILASFEGLLREVGVQEDAKYDNFAAEYSNDARFQAVAEETDRREGFRKYQVGLQTERERAARKELEAAKAAAAAAEKAAKKGEQEANFRKLLAENESVVATGDWAQVKRAIWVDKRWDAVPESRRRQLYTEYKDILNEAGVSGENFQRQAAAEKSQDLERLKTEQARLKEEYDMIQTKLKAMEKQLQISNLVGDLMDEVVVDVESNAKGASAFVYRFEESNGNNDGENEDTDGVVNGDKDSKNSGAKRGRKKVSK